MLLLVVLSGGSNSAPVQAQPELDIIEAATGGSEGLANSTSDLLEARQKLQ